MLPTCSHSQKRLDALTVELNHPSLLIRHIALCRLVHGQAFNTLTVAQLEALARQLRQAEESEDRTAAVLDQLVRQRMAEEVAADGQGACRDAVVGALCEHLRLPAMRGHIHANGTYAWSQPDVGGGA